MSDWPEREIQQLKKLWDEGLSTSLIANEMHRSRNAIIGKAHRLGMTRGIQFKPLVHMPGYYAPRKPKKKKPVPPRSFEHCCTIMQLTERRCHWPLWADGETARFYCGESVAQGVYCDYHRELGIRH